MLLLKRRVSFKAENKIRIVETSKLLEKGKMMGKNRRQKKKLNAHGTSSAFVQNGDRTLGQKLITNMTSPGPSLCSAILDPKHGKTGSKYGN